MTYATAADLEARYSNRDLVQLSNEDPAAMNVNAAYLATALADASSLIDTYLESRFELPLASPPPVLTLWCCTIAIYFMQNLRPVHDLQDARDRYDDVIKQLTAVRDGKLTLGLAPPGEEPSEPPPATETVLTVGADKMLTSRRLKGF